MNPDDPTLLEWAFKGMVAILLSIGAWLWVMLVKAVTKNKDDLADHKLNTALTYATKNDMSTSLMQINETMKRMHERIDGIYDLISKGTS